MKTKTRKKIKVIDPTWSLDTIEMRMYKSIKSLLPIGHMKCIERIKFEEHLWLISCNTTGFDPSNEEMKDKFMNMIMLID